MCVPFRPQLILSIYQASGQIQDNAIQGLKNGAEKLEVCNCYREQQPQSGWPASIKAMQLFPMFYRNSHVLSALYFVLTGSLPAHEALAQARTPARLLGINIGKKPL